jgi:hypothetical protein
MKELTNSSPLVNSEEKKQQLEYVICLKTAAAWLDQQEWVTTPYGGQNQVQDFLFHSHVVLNRIWQELFRNDQRNIKTNLKTLKRQILEMGNHIPELKAFFKLRINNKFIQRIWRE